MMTNMCEYQKGVGLGEGVTEPIMQWCQTCSDSRRHYIFVDHDDLLALAKIY